MFSRALALSEGGDSGWRGAGELHRVVMRSGPALNSKLKKDFYKLIWVNLKISVCINKSSRGVNTSYEAQNQSHIASVGFTVCMLIDILWPQICDSSEEKFAILRKTPPHFLTGEQKTEKPSGGGAEQGPSSRMDHEQKRTTTSQFKSCTDWISDTNYNICKVCGSRRQLEMGFMALWGEPDLGEPFLSKSRSKNWLIWLIFIFIKF